MAIRPSTAADLETWTALRAALWPDCAYAQHLEEAKALLAAGGAEAIALLDVSEDACARGFAEATLRHDHVNGCETSPVAFLEGVYVAPAHRRRGVGAGLVAAVQEWARGLGCSELASDAFLENGASRRFHTAFGFTETEQVVFFRKRL